MDLHTWLLPAFEARCPYLHFSVGPANYVAGSVCRHSIFFCLGNKLHRHRQRETKPSNSEISQFLQHIVFIINLQLHLMGLEKEKHFSHTQKTHCVIKFTLLYMVLNY